MIVPEPTSFIESSEAIATAVRNSGITMNEARTAFESLTMTNLDAIGFSYSIKPDIIYTSSRPEPIQELHNCNNCGGTVDEKGYCRYCGSRVYFFGE